MRNVFTLSDGSISSKRMWVDKFLEKVLAQYGNLSAKCRTEVTQKFWIIIKTEDPPYLDGLKVYYVP